MKSYNEYKNGGSVGAFFGKLFAVKQNAHILHLSSKSYAEHKALNGFYDDLTGLLDSLVETYQGQYGLITIDQSISKEKDAVSLMENAAREFAEARNLFDKKDTHLHNVIDEIVALCYQTAYKLKFLK